MTDKKQLKARIRARMAKTGERYSTARAHILGDTGPKIDHGWTLRGGANPESAALAGLLGLDEALVFGISGGIGAGYILWEFSHGPVVTIGFTSQWHRIAEPTRAAGRSLGVEVVEHTGGAKTATRVLRENLDAGRPVMIWPDRFHIGYWNVPALLDGHGGDVVLAYAIDDGKVHLDDRTLATLTVPIEDVERARARVTSWKNLSLTIPEPKVDPARIRSAVQEGIEDVVTRLTQSSDSFSLPTWRKWSRMMTDKRNKKGWPQVFADGTGLLRALASVWEGIEPVGMCGGNQRGLFADFLDQAAGILDRPALRDEAERWREIAGKWHVLAEAAFPADIPAVARIRELTATVSTAVIDGDAGRDECRAAAQELWDLRQDEPFTEAEAIFADMGRALADIHAAETMAVGILESATKL
ncbi:BtrH N-terminal domain-containing protein [Alloactinosynnema sp. L-07]|uniref:BtrH N-terminal domain-containing protein n=1 Tax=Alloactinosynnema sp. L-07 TaxID=1653480 RepID=UPI000AF79CB6|nr:BtrH N-terminal domain-containing protein [Alloactinosynnema sp. L-07]